MNQLFAYAEALRSRTREDAVNTLLQKMDGAYERCPHLDDDRAVWIRPAAGWDYRESPMKPIPLMFGDCGRFVFPGLFGASTPLGDDDAASHLRELVERQ